MKRIVIAMVLLLVPAIAVAAGLKDSGNKDLNRYLEGISNDVYQGRLSRAALDEHIKASFGLDQSALNVLAKRRLEAGEIYLVGLIHKATNRPAAVIVGAKGTKSWRDASYFLGSSPDELNTMRIADEKTWKRSARAGSDMRASKPPSETAAKAPVIAVQPQKPESKASPIARTMSVTNDSGEWDCTCKQKRK